MKLVSQLEQINLNTVKTGEMLYDATGKHQYRFIAYDAPTYQVIMAHWDETFTEIIAMFPRKVFMQAKTKKIWYNVWQRKYGGQDLFTVKYYTEESAKQNNQYYADDWILIGTHMAEVAA